MGSLKLPLRLGTLYLHVVFYQLGCAVYGEAWYGGRHRYCLFSGSRLLLSVAAAAPDVWPSVCGRRGVIDFSGPTGRASEPSWLAEFIDLILMYGDYALGRCSGSTLDLILVGWLCVP